MAGAPRPARKGSASPHHRKERHNAHHRLHQAPVRAVHRTMRALDNAGLDYQVVDLTTDPGALDYVRDGLGHLQAPVVDTDTAGHWSGFRPDRCKAIAAA